MTDARPYHHGTLRLTLMRHALDAIAASGPTGWSLRDLARRAGVSHAAPTHHFGDKTGLLTAVAIDGYRILASQLEASWTETGSALELGVAYVRFALANPAAFEVMYRPHLLHVDDRGLIEAQAAASRPLFVAMDHLASLDPSIDPAVAAIAAWSIVHGFASLWLDGDIPATEGGDPEAAIRAAAAYLFRPYTGDREATPTRSIAQ
jgi:AcrR family transcriptional regulator